VGEKPAKETEKAIKDLEPKAMEEIQGGMRSSVLKARDEAAKAPISKIG
jgi:hypothetical protein